MSQLKSAVIIFSAHEMANHGPLDFGPGKVVGSWELIMRILAEECFEGEAAEEPTLMATA